MDLSTHPIYDALFLAAEDDEVRGGAWLKEQYFWVDGAKERIGWMKYPLAESLVDKRHAGVPASMVIQFLRKQPLLMALGMGGHNAPFARLLGAIGWQSATIPFLFRISRPTRVLRGLTHLRRDWRKRVLMDLAAWSGVGWAVHRAWHLSQYNGPRAASTVESSFGPWADEIWERSKNEYACLAVRDAQALNWLYPDSFRGLRRLRVKVGDKDVGWAAAQVLDDTEALQQHFGTLSVGMVTDALAPQQDAITVLSAAVRHLEQSGVDLTIAYFCHTAWTTAAKRLRFLTGPSTLAFYRSPSAEKKLIQGQLQQRCHLTRSDGDGPIR